MAKRPSPPVTPLPPALPGTDPVGDAPARDRSLAAAAPRFGGRAASASPLRAPTSLRTTTNPETARALHRGRAGGCDHRRGRSLAPSPSRRLGRLMRRRRRALPPSSIATAATPVNRYRPSPSRCRPSRFASNWSRSFWRPPDVVCA